MYKENWTVMANMEMIKFQGEMVAALQVLFMVVMMEMLVMVLMVMLDIVVVVLVDIVVVMVKLVMANMEMIKF